MPGETDRDELRALQRKAYGREGGLTDAESARLRELEAAVREVPGVARETSPAVDGGPVDSVPGVADAGASEQGLSVKAETPRPSTIEDMPTSSEPRAAVAPRRVSRRRGWVIAAASALLLAIGVGAGWAVFGQRPEIVSLTPQQQERRLELSADGKFDEGSLRAIGQDEDALVWFATRSDGAQECLVIDIAQASSQACQDADDTKAFGLSASVMVPPNAGSDAESGVPPGSSVNATMMLSTTGEPLVSIQRWSSDLAMISQFEGSERDRARELVEQGFDAGLLVVGDFQSKPVWLGTRFAEGDDFIEYCMIVDGADGRTACSSDFDAAGRGVSTDIDGTIDGMPTTWNLRIQNARNQTPYLTIAQSVSFPNPGERMELGGEYGDPIEVTIPSEPEG